MERMISKLTVAFVVFLLLATAVTTASAQTQQELAEKGFAIAGMDPVLAKARFDGATDGFYLLGFDIATAIFGDPALGAQGNTAVGPGSLKFRNALNASGQRGFDASVKFNLSRNYKRTRGEVITPIEKRTGAEREKALESVKKPAAEPESTEIRCRGARGLLNSFTAENSRPDSTGATIITTLLTAEPGPYAAGPRGEGLRPGDCSWVDRPIAVTGVKDRWFLMRFETEANAQLKETLHGSEVDTSPTAAERFPDAQTIPAYMNDPKHYWSFFGVKQVNNFVISEEAYNRLHPLHLDDTMALSGYVATGHGYWKPFLEAARPVDSKRPNKDLDRVLIPKKPE